MGHRSGVARHQKYWWVGFQAEQFLRQGKSVHNGHADIRNYETAVKLVLRTLPGRQTIRRFLHAESAVLQILCNNQSEHRLVVSDNDQRPGFSFMTFQIVASAARAPRYLGPCSLC